MLKKHLTPDREADENTSPDQTLPLTALIFSGSTRKNHRTRCAEQRYSKTSQAFEKIEISDYNDELKSSKLLTYDESVKPVKHRRKSSIENYEKPILTKKHLRNISDADSVIYRQTEDEIGRQCGKSFSLRGSLPILEGTPCTIYCKYCETQVHSSVDYYNSSIPRKLLNVFSSLAACCQISSWLNDMRVHRCPHCSLVLGKVGTRKY